MNTQGLGPSNSVKSLIKESSAGTLSYRELDETSGGRASQKRFYHVSYVEKLEPDTLEKTNVR